MSWDIVLFNSKQKIELVSELDENQLVATDFTGILESSFNRINKVEKHREIIGADFTIDFFGYDEQSSNIMLSLYGENGFFELITLAKKHNWQVYDCGIGEMIDLENPRKNGFENHRKYVEQILNQK